MALQILMEFRYGTVPGVAVLPTKHGAREVGEVNAIPVAVGANSSMSGPPADVFLPIRPKGGRRCFTTEQMS